MREAGIVNPVSEEGIAFCTEKCPYKEGCVVYESTRRAEIHTALIKEAKRLKASGMSIESIADKLSRTTRSIRIYLGESETNCLTIK